MPKFGVSSLYTSTLFHFGEEFLQQMGSALELGLSFVAPEYQKGYLRLALLWKGIAAFVVRNPRYRMLFGPVSISSDYSPASRRLIVEFLAQQMQQAELARLVRPRVPYQPKQVKGWESASGSRILTNLDEVPTQCRTLKPTEKA